jgi:hypothetical protein
MSPADVAQAPSLFWPEGPLAEELHGTPVSTCGGSRNTPVGLLVPDENVIEPHGDPAASTVKR